MNSLIDIVETRVVDLEVVGAREESDRLGLLMTRMR